MPLFALGLAALACSVLGRPALKPTPPPAAAPAGQTATNGPTPLAALTAPASDAMATGFAAATGPAATGTTPEGVNLSSTGKAETPRLEFDAQGTLHLV